MRRVDPFLSKYSVDHASVALQAGMEIDDLKQELLIFSLKMFGEWDPERGSSWFGYFKNGLEIKKTEIASHSASLRRRRGTVRPFSEFEHAFDDGEVSSAFVEEITATSRDAPGTVELEFKEALQGMFTPSEGDILAFHFSRGKTAAEISHDTGESLKHVEATLEKFENLASDSPAFTESVMGTPNYLQRARAQSRTFYGRGNKLDYARFAKVIRHHFVEGKPLLGLPSQAAYYRAHKAKFRDAFMKFIKETSLRVEADPKFWSDPKMQHTAARVLGSLGTERNLAMVREFHLEGISYAALAKKYQLHVVSVRRVVASIRRKFLKSPELSSFRNQVLAVFSDEATYRKFLAEVFGPFSESRIAIGLYALLEREAPHLMANRFQLKRATVSLYERDIRTQIDQVMRNLPSLEDETLYSPSIYMADRPKAIDIQTTAAILVQRYARDVFFSRQNDDYFGRDVRDLLLQALAKRYKKQGLGSLDDILEQLVHDAKLKWDPQQVEAWISAWANGEDPREVVAPKLKIRSPRAFDKTLRGTIQHFLAKFNSQMVEFPASLLDEGQLPAWVIRKAVQRTLRDNPKSIGGFRQVFVEGAKFKVLRQDEARRVGIVFRSHVNDIIREWGADLSIPRASWDDLVGLPTRSNVETIERQMRVVLRHLVDNNSMSEIGRLEGLTTERVSQIVEAADQKMHLWLSKKDAEQGKVASLVVIDTSSDMRHAFLIRRTVGKNLTPRAQAQIDRARAFLSPEYRELISKALDEGKVASAIQSDFAHEGRLYSHAEVTQDLKSARSVLEDLLYAVKAYEEFPAGSIPFAESEALPLLRIYRQIERVSTLPPRGELVEKLRRIRAAIEKLSDEKLSGDSRQAFEEFYVQNRSMRQLVTPDRPISRLRTIHRALIREIESAVLTPVR